MVDLASVGLGIATGLSEISGAYTAGNLAYKGAKAVDDAISPDKLSAPNFTAAQYGSAPNPDYQRWVDQKARLDAQAAANPAWAKAPSGYAASIANLGPAPPQTIQVSTLGAT
jgi:hypothetical protein